MSGPTFSVVQNPFDFGRLKIGQASALQPFTITNTSPITDLVIDNCVIFNLTGGGQVIVGCGQGAANGVTVPLPAGFDTSRLVLFTTPGTGHGPDQLEGVNVCSGAGGVFNTKYQDRTGAPSINATSTNYVLAAWTLGAAVTVTTVATSVGNATQVSFVTDQGDDLCIAEGVIASAEAFPVPAGFAAAQFLYTAGPASSVHTGHGWQEVFQCNLAAGTLVGTLLYADNSSNSWGGNLNVFGVFYKTGGGVTTAAVTGGTALLIPGANSSSLTLIFTSTANGASFGLPAGFTGTVSQAPSVTGFVAVSGNDVCHGYTVNTLAGVNYSGVYQDDAGHSWGAVSTNLAVAVMVPSLGISISNIASNAGEFALSNLPAFPKVLNPGESVIFDVTCTAAFRGFTSYPEALTITVDTFPLYFVQLSYTGFLLTPAYTLTGATQGVLMSLAGDWNTGLSTFLVQSLASLPTEADAYWENQYDFDNASSNSYLSKVFLRTEPSGSVTATMYDTARVGDAVSTVSSTFTQTGVTDSSGLVQWMQFDFENNGESHLLKFLIPANLGRVIISIIILQYEPRGVVYENT